MIESIKDNVLRSESFVLLKAIVNGDSKLTGKIEIHENPNSGWIYAADEDCTCYLMRNDKLEEHVSCPECGYENFVSDFEDEMEQACCKEYFNEFNGE